MSAVEFVDGVCEIGGDRSTFAFTGRSYVGAAGLPDFGDDRELLDLLDSRQFRGRAVDAGLHGMHDCRVGDERGDRCVGDPVGGSERCACVGVEADQRGVVGACVADHRRQADQRTVRGDGVLDVGGDMFLPAALMMMSFLRPTMRRLPSGSSSPRSPVCSHQFTHPASMVNGH